ncbi:MAG: SPOR domain-containing protein [Breznakibacter sp.]
MGTIASHITALVHLYDCVIVPGLGAFVGNVRPAEIMREKGLFVPPKKEIGFNRSLQHNDGLLCDYIARREGITFAESQKQIEEFVKCTLDLLANKQVVVIDEVGELKKDALGNILFWPNNSALFLPEAFGLASFHITMTQTAAIKSLHHHQSEMSQMWLRRISQRKWVAGVALFVGLFLLTNELRTPDSVNMGAMLPAFNTVLASSQPIEEVRMEEGTPKFSVVDIDSTEGTTITLQTETASAAQVSTPTADVLFYLVAASFPDKAAADRFKQKMVDNGYGASEVLAVDGKNRVAIDKFTTRADAFAALENYRQIKGFETVWLLKNHKR